MDALRAELLTALQNRSNIPGSLPLSVSALSPRAQDIHRRINQFIADHCIPLEKELFEWSTDQRTKWTVHPRVEQLKQKARQDGLWNLFLTKDYDPDGKYGAGLTNTEYAFMAEQMGRTGIASEVFNCSAPDTGNMEVLARYGNDEQKRRWLIPLLNGEIRSCFAMTEPEVASSDAANIRSSIRRDGNDYVINGHKWWTSGAMDPRCKLCLFMGKTSSTGDRHSQQSVIIVPMDSPGVRIVRPLSVMGYDDAPHGHAELLFENVRVPASNMILGEGRGFEIGQGRLGGGRIHHCMRAIGAAERALELLIDRALNRVAFGRRLAEQGSIQQNIALSRIDIEQCRLLVLKTAYMIDTVGNKATFPEIAMIKACVPKTIFNIVDRALQVHGGLGVSNDTPLAFMFAGMRALRIADGPDEVHLRTVARLELFLRQASTPSKL